MARDTLRDLFQKLRIAQLQMEHASLGSFSSDYARCQNIMRSIILELRMPKIVEKLKAASVEAQAAHLAHREGKITLEARNETVKKAVDARDEMIHLLDYSMQIHLEDFNDSLRAEAPELVAEFGIWEANHLCAAS